MVVCVGAACRVRAFHRRRLEQLWTRSVRTQPFPVACLLAPCRSRPSRLPTSPLPPVLPPPPHCRLGVFFVLFCDFAFALLRFLFAASPLFVFAPLAFAFRLRLFFLRLCVLLLRLFSLSPLDPPSRPWSSSPFLGGSSIFFGLIFSFVAASVSVCVFFFLRLWLFSTASPFFCRCCFSACSFLGVAFRHLSFRPRLSLIGGSVFLLYTVSSFSLVSMS